MRNQRLIKELAKLEKLPPTGISVSAKDDTLDILEASITGPEETPYHNGVFRLELLIPEAYPFSPPSIKFLTPIYHPNIDDNGRVCLDLIKMPPLGFWKPLIGIEGIMLAVRMLLKEPNPDDPLMAEIGDEFKNNPSEYNRKAKLYTEANAVS